MDDENENDHQAFGNKRTTIIMIYYCCFAIGLISNMIIIKFTFRKNIKSAVQIYFLLFMIISTLDLILNALLASITTQDVPFLIRHSTIIVQMGMTILGAEFLIVVVLIIIWFFAINNRIFKGHFKFITFTILIILTVYYFGFVWHCKSLDTCNPAMYILLTVNGLIIIELIIMHIINFVLKYLINNGNNQMLLRHNNFILIVLTLYYLCWSPGTLLAIGTKLNLSMFDYSMYIICDSFGCLYSFFNLIAFLLLYKNWRMQFMNLLNCYRRFYVRNDENLIDDTVDEVSEVTTI